MTYKRKWQVKEVVSIPCFQFICEDGRIDRIDFIPCDKMPGFSHRVAFNRQLTQRYLGEQFAPNKRNALDMYDLLRTSEIESALKSAS